MKIVKIILEGNLVIPLTTAEAVVVMNNGTALTLDKVLNKKIEQIIPVDLSGLTITLLNTNVFINHTNLVNPLLNERAQIIAYDSHGHITNSKDLGTHNILVNNKVITNYTGNENVTTEFGDDFKVDNSKIQINWNNI